MKEAAALCYRDGGHQLLWGCQSVLPHLEKSKKGVLRTDKDWFSEHISTAGSPFPTPDKKELGTVYKHNLKYIGI